jgi:hypothetical protein
VLQVDRSRPGYHENHLMEYVNSLNLKGSVSQRFTNAIAITTIHGASFDFLPVGYNLA